MCYSIYEESYLELDDCSFVVIEVAIVGRGEDSDYGWKLFGAAPMIHLKPISLGLMCPDD